MSGDNFIELMDALDIAKRGARYVKKVPKEVRAAERDFATDMRILNKEATMVKEVAEATQIPGVKNCMDMAIEIINAMKQEAHEKELREMRNARSVP